YSFSRSMTTGAHQRRRVPLAKSLAAPRPPFYHCAPFGRDAPLARYLGLGPGCRAPDGARARRLGRTSRLLRCPCCSPRALRARCAVRPLSRVELLAGGTRVPPEKPMLELPDT